MNFAVQNPPTAVISARTSRCYYNTIHNKISSIPLQKKGKHNTSKTWKQLVVVENMPPSGSSQRKNNHSQPCSAQKLNTDTGFWWRQSEGDTLALPLLAASQSKTSATWRKTECGNNARHVHKLIHLPKEFRDAWEKQDELETDPLSNRLMGWVHGLCCLTASFPRALPSAPFCLPFPFTTPWSVNSPVVLWLCHIQSGGMQALNGCIVV